jgi:hypothetical protein
MADYIRKELDWWTSIPNLTCGVVFPTPPATRVLSTDASLSGWGGHLYDQTASGVWTDLEARSHINLLELWAVRNTVQVFEESLRGCRVLVQSDNSTVVAYMNKEGGLGLLYFVIIRYVFWPGARTVK